MFFSVNRRTFWKLAFGAGSVAYPFLVYAWLGRLPPEAFVVMALALIGARLVVSRGNKVLALSQPLLLVAAGATAVTGVFDPALATLLYPVLMSGGMALAFGFSLIYPPSLIEVVAALTSPAPGPATRAYQRKVTAVWCGFLVFNTMASAATALYGDPALWAIYNGLISYLLMGVLFGGEYLVRRRVLRRVALPWG